MKRLFFIMLLVSLTGLLSAQNNITQKKLSDEIQRNDPTIHMVKSFEVSIAGEIDVWLDTPYRYQANPSFSNWTYVWEIEKDHRCSYSISGNQLYVKFNQGGVYHITCRIYDENMKYVGDGWIEALIRYP